jgi:hypothetical protein
VSSAASHARAHRQPAAGRGHAGSAAPSHAVGAADLRQAVNSPSQALPAERGAELQGRFPLDFARVRIHDNPVGHTLAGALGARAFTFGHHVVFGRGQFQPRQPLSGSVLGHELGHVVQQRHARLAFDAPVPVLDERHPLEQAADHWAAGGGLAAPGIWRAPKAVIQRQVGGPLSPLSQGAGLRQAGEEAKQLTARFAEVAKPLKDALLGEFEQDPSTAGIAIDMLLGLVPGLDQALDVRDLVAHAVSMVETPTERTRVMRWVSVALTLIGVVPEIGSVIKGVCKIIIKKGAHAANALGEVLEQLRHLWPDSQDLLRDMAGTMASKWDSWIATGKLQWEELLTLLEDWATELGKSELAQALGEIKAASEEMLDKAFAHLDEAVGRFLQQLGIEVPAFGPRPALAGGVPDGPAAPLMTTGSGPKPRPKKPRQEPAADPEIDALVDDLENTAKSPMFKGRKKPRMPDPNHPKGSRAIPTAGPNKPRPYAFDDDKLPRREGETLDQALTRVSLIVGTKGGMGRKLVHLPGVAAEWVAARKQVRGDLPNPTDAEAAREAYDAVRQVFWERVFDNATLKKVFEGAGFEFPAPGRAPRLAGVDPSVPAREITISLDHGVELAADPARALDETNLDMKFAAPNTDIEIQQARAGVRGR